MGDRFRSIAFTINNYSAQEVADLKDNLQQQQYAVFQFEIGENGTPHVQGYCYAKSAKTLSAWKKVVGRRAHIERAKGDAVQNREYCTKEDTRAPGTQPWESGKQPAQGERTDLAAVAKAVVEGKTDQEIAEEYPGDVIRYHRGISYLRGLYERPRTWKTNVFWWYGPTGTGKSFEAYQRFPEAYWKMGCNKWWDGYRGESAVIIDDYRPDLCTFAELLRLLDRYPYRVEFKGGSSQFVARDLVITCPKHPRDMWATRTEEDIQQLLRRIDEVKFFPFAYNGAAAEEPGAVTDRLDAPLTPVYSLLEGNVDEIENTN